jgi:quinol monooxygenase YgiN
VKESSFMPTISKDDDCVTLINVFTVEPSNQKKLIQLLIEATETSVRNVQGFISASFHRSLDGTKVTAYAQWRSAECYQAMRKNSVALPYMEQALALATFDSGMYEVAATFDGDKAP